MPFCTGSPLYFCEFLLIYNIANRGILQAACLLFKLSQVMPGHIERKCKIAPCCPDAPGAYFNKISCYAPLFRYRRGLFWQNLLLRPAVPISPGLILAKSLATPRCYDLPGAYSDRISFYAPPFRYRRGLS